MSFLSQYYYFLFVFIQLMLYYNENMSINGDVRAITLK